MLELDTMRGPHSTGVAYVSRAKDVKIEKTLGTPWDFYKDSRHKERMRGSNCVLLGHNRWATKGAVTKENAHPFMFEHVVGAHNGTLVGQWLLDDYRDFEVDSENIYHHMNKNGIHDTVKKLDGAFALTWYDKRNHSLNLSRNSQRPLHYAFSEDGTYVMWASVAWMIELAAEMHNLKIQECVPVVPEKLYHFEIPAKFGDGFMKPRVSSLEVYEPPVKKHSGGSVFNGVMTSSHGRQVYQHLPIVHDQTTRISDFVGRIVDVRISACNVGTDGRAYVRCRMMDNHDNDVRIPAKVGSKLWNTAQNSPNSILKVRVRGFEYFQGRAHLVGDPGSVTIPKATILPMRKEPIVATPIVSVMVEEDSQLVVLNAQGELIPQKKLYEVYGGALATEEQYTEDVKVGCAWCLIPPASEDHLEVVWLGPREFICPECVDFPEVREYIGAR